MFSGESVANPSTSPQHHFSAEQALTMVKIHASRVGALADQPDQPGGCGIEAAAVRMT
ncbi:MAG: hypothetical protein RLZZ611_1078 [Cyanobacteriota bacterium]|jgi:hypothetical protein